MKADVKSSGIAAPVAQPRPPGGLGTSLAPFSDDLKNGANAFMLMLERVREIGDDTVLHLGEHVDGRDYRAIAFEIETAIYANLMGSTKATRDPQRCWLGHEWPPSRRGRQSALCAWPT